MKEKNNTNTRLQNVKFILSSKLKSSWRGRKLFLSIYKKNKGSGKTAYIIFPEDDAELNYYGLLYLNDLSDFSSFDSFVIITSCNIVAKSALYFCNKIRNIYEISKENSDQIISYFSLYNFYNHTYLISLDIPDARRGSNILGKNGITKELIVGVGIYRIMPFRQDKHSIVYDGDLIEIKEFIDRKW